MPTHSIRQEGKDQDFDKAFYYFNLSAKNGNLSGLHNLSGCYREGLGVAKDMKMFWKLTRQAAARGHPKAQFLMYMTQPKRKQNKKEAFRLFQEAKKTWTKK